MSAYSDPSLPEDLPAPSAELAMMRVVVEAYLATIPRKRAIKQLQLMAELLTQSAATDANVLPFRLKHDRDATMEARRKALAWFRHVLPAWMSALDAD